MEINKIDGEKNDVKRSEAPGRLRPGREQPVLAIHAQDKLDTAQQDQGDCGREGPLLNEKKQKRGGPQQKGDLTYDPRRAPGSFPEIKDERQ